MRPAIIGIAGPVLSAAEARAIAAHGPAGIILFGRNIEDPAQLGALVRDVRGHLPDQAVLMVDQEGGRVARLRPPHWPAHPPARDLGRLYARDPAVGERAAWLTGASIGLTCADAGFDVVAAPVLDVASEHGHDVIGDRAFSADPRDVAALGRAMAAGLLAAGVQPVGKHVPGHGRARADSHAELPVLDDIAESDLAPFIANTDLPWMMTAHIRYTARDMTDPATHSAAIIARVIRGRIGFGGVLVSDDLAMQALSGAPGTLGRRALLAGCDIALHCSGVLAESLDVLEAIPPMTPLAAGRMAAARRMAEARVQGLDWSALDAERRGLLA
jgi:beta-N-acetylhexosaminidase